MHVNSASDQREYLILEDLEKTPEISQRSLSRKHNISLGLVNTFLKRLVTKGMVKAHHVDGKKLAYVLTAKGIAEKALLTYQYLEASLQHYQKARHLLTRTIEEIKLQGYRRIFIWGSREWSEICYLTAQEHELEVAGFVGAEPGKFLGRPQLPLADLAGQRNHNACIVTINCDKRELPPDCRLPVFEVVNANFKGID